MGKKPLPSAAGHKKDFQFDHSDEEADSPSYRDLDDDEVPDEKGFDLRGKSLANTLKKTREPKKAALPLKAIMSDILSKTRMPIGGSNPSDGKPATEVRACNLRSKCSSRRRNRY
jgi:hypothetical protein